MTTLSFIDKRHRAQAKAWAFFMLPIICGLSFHSNCFAEKSAKRPIVEELSSEEKEMMIKESLAEGDRLTERKEYNLANASYESVFVIEPNHIEASKRIDKLKKLMVKEGISETQLVTRVYDEEIEMRVRQYLAQAKDLIEQGKLAQARFNLQKLLLVSPLNEEGTKLYEQINQRLEQAA